MPWPSTASTTNPGVLIGGTAPADLKEQLRQAIQQVLPAGLDVRVALPNERFGGDDPNNIVNRLSPCGGIQIEQGPSARDDHGCDIADVVADFFRPATVPRVSWARRGIERVLARVWEATQSLVDRLRRRHPG